MTSGTLHGPILRRFIPAGAAGVGRMLGAAIACLLLPCAAGVAQLTVSNQIPIPDLVRKYFAGGCAQISNVSYSGDNDAIGYFNGSSSNIGVSEGVILCTGRIGIAPGPNNLTNAGYDNNHPGDQDLTNLVNAPTYDAAILEFDFVSFKDTVSFEYVFGSEEYEEYVGSAFNDVFAFFISGPGISGKENIALIPGTNTPVSINNVNQIVNTQYYINNNFGLTVQYDGFTKVLKAKLAVTACVTYHMKIAIADVSDHVYDSGVFLKSGSFNQGSNVSVRVIRGTAEGACTPGIFRIQRTGSRVSSLTVNFTIGGTATNGVDYTTIPSSITIPAGQDYVDLPIEAIQDFIPDPDETVIISVDSQCSCSQNTAEMVIHEAPPLTAKAESDTVVCLGPPLTLTGIVTGGSGSYKYEWSGGLGHDSLLTFRPLASQTIILTASDTIYGCVAKDTVQVVVNIPPKADAGPDVIACPLTPVRIGRPTTGGTPPYSYQWDPPDGLDNPTSGTPLAHPSGYTTYVVTVTSADGCQDQDTVNVSLSDFAISAGPDTVVCEGNGVFIGDLASGGKPPFTYQWRPPSGLNATTIATPFATPRTTTRYFLAVRDGEGCELYDTVTVRVEPEPKLSISPPGPLLICEGDSVTLDAGPGYAGYIWSTGQKTQRIVVTMGGTYSVSVWNGAGCGASQDVLISTYPKPSPSISPAGPIRLCQGDSVILRVIGSYSSYTWSTGDTTTYIQVKKSGVYTLRARNSYNCIGIADPVEVIVSPYPSPRITGPRSVCRGTEAVYGISPTGGNTLFWKVEGGTLLTLPTDEFIRVLWDVSGPGRILLTVTADSSGCRSDSIIAINVGATLAPSITAAKFLLCQGDTAHLDAGAGYAGYDWSTGARTQTIGVTRSGRYAVRVQDAAGCTGTDTVAVTFFPNPSPAIVPSGPTSICEGDSVLLTAGAAYARYRWSTGDTTNAIHVRSTGKYTLTVFDSLGCSGISPVIDVAVTPLPFALIDGPWSLCTDSRGVYAAPDIPGQSYTWSVRNGTIVSGQGSDSLVVQWGAQSGLVILTVTAAGTTCSATRSDSVRIAATLTPVITASGSANFCLGDSVTLDAGAGYATYLWSNGETTRRIVLKTSGFFTVAVSDANGCSGASSPFGVRMNLPPAVAISGPVSACINSIEDYDAPAAGNMIYDWTVAGGSIIAGGSTNTITVRWPNTGTGTVALRMIDRISNCAAETSMTVLIASSLKPVITASGPVNLCEGDSVRLDAGAGFSTYAWSNGSTERFITVKGPGAQSFTVNVSDAGGCSGVSDPFTVQFNPVPQPLITPGPRVAFCLGDSAVLSAPPGFSRYLWSTGAASRQIVVRQGGNYTVTVTDANGCTGVAPAVLVSVNLPPDASIAQSGADLAATSASAIAAYQWYRDGILLPGETLKNLRATFSGSYTVRVTDINGCSALSPPVVVQQDMASVVSLPLIEAYPGERVSIPLTLQSSRNLPASSSGDFSATLRMQKNILLPVGSTPQGTIQRDFRIIPVTGARADTIGPLTVLGKPALDFVAALGDVESTPLYIDLFDWSDGRIAVTTLNGEFRLKICREGGARLIRSEGRITLQQNRPNPFNAMTRIEYETIERGRTQLFVLDMMGRRVATIVDAEIDPGRYEVLFDASQLSSGSYFYFLLTPTRTLQKMMQVVK